jgi:L-amino acid N-acyltransferase YncA
LIIRIAKESDLKSIVEIYNQAIPLKKSTADLNPVTVEGREEWFKEHEADKFPIFVVEIDERIVGWVSLSPYRKGREALRHTFELSYYIDSDYKGKGLGNALLDFVIKKSSNYDVKTLIAIILEYNKPSLALVKKFKFEQWGYLPAIADFNGEECGHIYYGLRVRE